MRRIPANARLGHRPSVAARGGAHYLVEHRAVREFYRIHNYTGRIESVGFRLASGGVTARDVVLRGPGGDEAAEPARIKMEKFNVGFSWIQFARRRFLGDVAITRTL